MVNYPKSKGCKPVLGGQRDLVRGMIVKAIARPPGLLGAVKALLTHMQGLPRPPPFPPHVSKHWDGATSLEVYAWVTTLRQGGGARGIGSGEGGEGATSINLDLAPGCLKLGSRTEGDKFKSVCCSQNRRGKKDMDPGFRVENSGCNM